MIQMKSGVYGGTKKQMRPEDGPFTLTPEEEARLVKRGVAKYVNDDGETVVEGKSLDNMTLAELRTVAKELGLSLKFGINKADAVKAIQAFRAEVANDDGQGDEGDKPNVNPVVDPADGTEDADNKEDDGNDAPPVINPTEAVQ